MSRWGAETDPPDPVSQLRPRHLVGIQGGPDTEVGKQDESVPRESPPPLSSARQAPLAVIKPDRAKSMDPRPARAGLISPAPFAMNLASLTLSTCLVIVLLPAAHAALPSFDSSSTLLPPLSLREAIRGDSLLPKPRAIEPTLQKGDQWARPARPGPRARRAPSRMPVIEPDPDINYTMLVQHPDPTVDYKLLVRPGSDTGNATR
jgi:hypothetical protein